MMRYGHKTGLTAVHECCGDGTWYVMLSEDEMRNTLGMAARVVTLSPFISFTYLSETYRHYVLFLG